MAELVLITQYTFVVTMLGMAGASVFFWLERDTLEANFRNWAPLFNARYSVFLEIQRGAWEARKAWQKQNPLAQPQYESSTYAFDLLKIYSAGWLAEPGAASLPGSRRGNDTR